MPNKMLLAWGDSWLSYRSPAVLLKQSNLMSNLRPSGFTDAPQSPTSSSGLELATMAGRPATDPVYTMFADLLNDDKNALHAIVLSAGGNDCVKGHLRDFVKPKGSATDIDPIAWKAHLGVLRSHYAAILGKFKAIADSLNASVPVIVHGYDHPVADGRFLFGGPGSRAWIHGPLVMDLGYSESEATDIMRRLIDGLNDDMLVTLEGDASLGTVRYVNLRNTLRAGAGDGQWFGGGGYKDAWENELHPTPNGFKALAAKIQARL